MALLRPARATAPTAATSRSIEAASKTTRKRCSRRFPISVGERYAKTYVINLLRCIYCGYCVEACPTEALQMKREYELAAPDRASLIVSKEQLLAPLPKREPEDSWLPG